MSVGSLQYDGPSPNLGEGSDIMNQTDATTILTSGPVNQIQAGGDISTAASGYATTSGTNTTLQNYALPSYHQTKDALHIPNTALGQPNGVATLNAASPATIPLAQCPSLGGGYFYGPFGPTAIASNSVSASATPINIAYFDIGIQSVSTFQMMCFFSAFVSSNGGFPVIQIGISNGQAVYASQRIIAQGIGRQGYNDPQAISVVPVTATTGNTPSSPAGLAGGSYHIWLTAWLFDGTSTQTSTLASGNVVNASAFIIRGAQ